MTPANKLMGPPQSVRTMSRSPSKRNPTPGSAFLTKDSSTRTFNHSIGAPWDHAAREKSMEEFFDKFVSRMSQTGQESYGYKEAVGLYKTRGKHDLLTGGNG